MRNTLNSNKIINKMCANAEVVHTSLVEIVNYKNTINLKKDYS